LGGVLTGLPDPLRLLKGTQVFSRCALFPRLRLFASKGLQ
jgi:hypothetical protein